MSTEEMFAGIMQDLPDDISLQEVARRIKFIAAVREGFEADDREGGVSVDEARARVSTWA